MDTLILTHEEMSVQLDSLITALDKDDPPTYTVIAMIYNSHARTPYMLTKARTQLRKHGVDEALIQSLFPDMRTKRPAPHISELDIETGQTSARARNRLRSRLMKSGRTLAEAELLVPKRKAGRPIKLV